MYAARGAVSRREGDPEQARRLITEHVLLPDGVPVARQDPGPRGRGSRRCSRKKEKRRKESVLTGKVGHYAWYRIKPMKQSALGLIILLDRVVMARSPSRQSCKDCCGRCDRRPFPYGRLAHTTPPVMFGGRSPASKPSSGRGYVAKAHQTRDGQPLRLLSTT